MSFLDEFGKAARLAPLLNEGKGDGGSECNHLTLILDGLDDVMSDAESFPAEASLAAQVDVVVKKLHQWAEQNGFVVLVVQRLPTLLPSESGMQLSLILSRLPFVPFPCLLFYSLVILSPSLPVFRVLSLFFAHIMPSRCDSQDVRVHGAWHAL